MNSTVREQSLDTLIEGVARLAWYVLREVLILGIFYWPGWLILRVITVGRYPPPRPQRHNEDLVAGVPIVLFLVGITVYYS